MRTLISRKTSLLLGRKAYFKNNYSTKSLGLWNEEFTDTVRHKVEEHWRPKLKKCSYNVSDDKSQKFYVLSMFPYPSGNLHMGHVRVYTISDTIARFHRMQGKNVIHPMGWDAFGLPAENAAIERNQSPENWTYSNIKVMKEQLKGLECCFDWDRELATCHPGYYAFTQHVFLKLYEAGLVYEKEALVNWDPVDKTVLADEQVDEQGRSWRSGAKVEKKPLRQWFVRTTKFAKSLYDGLDDPSLVDWRDITKLQRNWIGECNGWAFDFHLVGKDIQSGTLMTLWTSRPEHIAKAKFVVVAHGSLLDKLGDGEGNRRLDCQVINPVSGDRLPVYVSDKMEFEEGCDARLGIPDAFEVDKDFAKLVNIAVNCDDLLEEDVEERSRVCDEALANKYGGYMTSAKLKDWLISRQRYWGTPIPLVHCKTCGVQPVAYEDLPVLLPSVHSSSDTKISTLQQSTDWIKTTCPKCKGVAERETDTMDTFVDSSWYYLRYLDPRNNQIPFSKDLAAAMYPVDVYVGGKEHATLHLYYARFVAHFLHSIGWTNAKEPFKRMLVQGMVMGKTYRVKGTGKYLKEGNILRKDKKQIVEKETGAAVTEKWEKMSKSKYNGVEPADMLSKYGTDTTRLLILADVSPTSNRHWNEQTFPGVTKWQHRLWLTVKEFIDARSKVDSIEKSATFDEQEHFLWDSRNYYLKGINFSYSTTYLFSTAISKMQGLTGSLRKSSPDVVALSGEYERALVLLAVVLAPIAPHFASELWAGIRESRGRINKIPNEIDWSKPIEEHPWPMLDSHYNLELHFLVNNACKSTIKLPQSEFCKLTEEHARMLALEDSAVREFLAGRSIFDSRFRLSKDYEADINLLVDVPKKRKSDSVVEENERLEQHL